MAITTRKVLFRSRIFGGGHDSSGNPQQGKEIVTGLISGTYVTGGAALTAEDMGLASVDFVAFRVTTPALVAGTGSRAGDWLSSSSVFMLHDPDGTTQEGNGTTFTAEYIAFGNSAHDLELLP